MTLVMRVLSGARAGHVLTSDAPRIRVGRAADAELRFDRDRDLNVSARHALITRVDGRFHIRDQGSRNGTWVNGARVVGDVALSDGDRVVFGTGGPEVELRILDAVATGIFESPAAVPVTRVTAAQERPPAARSMRGWRPAAAVLVLLGVVTVAFVTQTHRERRDWEAQRTELQARIDSAVTAGDATIVSLQGDLDDLAQAVRASQEQVVAAGSALDHATRSGDAGRVPALRSRFEGALTNLTRQSAVAGIDHAAIRDRNGRAVARIFVESAGGDVATGTAFAISADATLLTSRHVVAPDGAPARRIAVQFSYSDQVWPARLVAVDDANDIAIVKIDAILGSVPVVAALNTRSDTLPSGTPVVLIGYPLGGESSASDRPGRSVIRPLVGAGTLTSLAGDVMELQAYGATGASGSPVFDANGEVMGIAFGGRRENGVDYVVAVPARAAARLLERLSLK
jgi:pSer/pThr/pTyr-binding forkhead associated (FHA) protein/V8-like Glu-specific endopeptidase